MVVKSAGVPTSYAFGPFVVDPLRRLVLCDGERVPMTAKVFDLLLLLLDNRGQVVRKDELSRRLWPNTHVSETSLAVNVSALRKALGDSRDAGTYIVTVTGHGYRFAAPVATGSAPVDGADRAGPETGLPRPRAAGRLPILAVLPFRSLSAGRPDEVLEVGLADAIITRLSRLPLLTVRPTSSVLRYASSEPDIAGVGAELKADYVLTGGVQRAGARVRVTAQLIRLRDGATLWARTWDQAAGDVFQIEDLVSQHVTSALRLKLSGAEREALTAQHTQNPKAYDLYLRSRFFWNKRTEKGLLKGIEYGEAAVAEDPAFALAHVAVADCYTALAFFGGIHPRIAYTRAVVLAGKALMLDGSLADAHTSMGYASLASWDWTSAAACFARALELNPRNANARNWHTVYLLSLRLLDEAVEEATRAKELDPLSLVLNANVGWVLFHARRYEEALEQADHVLDMDQHFAVAHWVAGLTCMQLGRMPRALTELERAVEMSAESPYAVSSLAFAQALTGSRHAAKAALAGLVLAGRQRYISPHHLAHIHVALGETDAAFHWLERAFQDRSDYMPLLGVDPLLDTIRDDPRFADVIRRVGIPGL